MSKVTPKREWHQLFGDLLDVLLKPLDLCVEVDRKIQNGPPRVDVLIRREQGDTWTDAQRAALCDGIRDVDAAHILIEFKFSENLNERNLFQAVMYFFLYTNARDLDDREACAFLVCSQTPQKNNRAQFGFQPTDKPGVYQSVSPLVERATLIALNELANTPYNATFKIFASRQAEIKKAFDTLERYEDSFSIQFQRLVLVAYNFWYNMKGGIGKMLEYTREQVMRFAKTSRGKTLFSKATIEERLTGLTEEEKVIALTAGVPKEKRLAMLLAELSKEEVQAFLSRFSVGEDGRD